MDGAGYYPYQPSTAAATIAMLLFGSSAFFHLWQAIKTKTGFFTAFLCGAFMMTLGYIFRLISARDTSNLTPYIGQSMCIILPPSLYAATIYMIYGRIVLHVNKPQLSIIAPRKVTKVFVLGDTLAFLLQGSGGGLQVMDSMRNMGNKILLIGLFVQLIFFGFFLIVSLVFEKRLRSSGFPLGDNSWRGLLYVLFFVSALIIIRCIYRIIEYVAGTDGYLATHEVYVYILDAIPMFLVQAIFHWKHPGKILVGGKVLNDPWVNLHDMP